MGKAASLCLSGLSRDRSIANQAASARQGNKPSFSFSKQATDREESATKKETCQTKQGLTAPLKFLTFSLVVSSAEIDIVPPKIRGEYIPDIASHDHAPSHPAGYPSFVAAGRA